jgi:HAMP domain-containing protein
MSQASMSQTFVVEVTEKPEVTPESALESLAKAFNIPTRKVELMLKRLPGVATKPITEQEAAVVVSYFEQAGLKALVKSVNTPVSSATTPSTRVSATPETSATSLPATSLPVPVGTTTSSTELPSPKSSPEIAKERLETASKNESPEPNTTPAISTPPPMARPEENKEGSKVAADVAVTELPKVEPTPRPQEHSAVSSPDLLKALSEAPQMLAAQPFTPPPSSPSISFTPVPPPSRTEKRTEHDILRTTLIGEPDPRKTYGGQEVYTSSSSLTSAGQSRSNQLSNRMLLTAIFPTLLTFLGTLAAVALMLQPFFNESQQSVRNPAVAIAASLSSVLTATDTGEVNYGQLQSSLEATRLAFENLPIAFVAVTDSTGQVLPASWFESSTFASAEDVRERITEQASSAISGEASLSPAPLNVTSDLELVARPLTLEGQKVGAVVVGTTPQTPAMNFWQLLSRMALFSLIPFALASLLAILATRPITSRIHYLTRRADEISRGQLHGSIELKGNDELSSLAEALERLRVSMQGALERLRRRR